MKKLVIILFLFLTNIAIANTISCKVVAIIDGDTIKCLTNNNKRLRIRLYQIDAPEMKQAFGNKSKQVLSDLIFNKQVQIKTHGKDKYNRILGTIILMYKGSCKTHLASSSCAYFQNINLTMITKGMAWYWPFAEDNERYKEAEIQARIKKIGLWINNKPLEPWKTK